jgi:hypothetical protein
MKVLAKWTLALGGLLGWAVPTVVWACEYSDDQSVYEVLGVAGLPSQRMPVSLPRNVAFVFFARENGARPQLTAAGAAIELELLGVEPERSHFGLQTPREPLVPGMTYSYDLSGPFTVDDYIDETAPEPPRITKAAMEAFDYGGSCGGSSCNDIVSVKVRLTPGTDDHTTTTALTYAMYIGESAEAARTTTQVERFLVQSGQEDLILRESYDWTERDMFVSVSALDHAGNESHRTEPVQINHAPSGCRIGRDTGLSSFAWILALIMWRAARQRRSYERRLRARHMRSITSTIS